MATGEELQRYYDAHKDTCTWDDVAARFGEMSGESARSKGKRWRKRQQRRPVPTLEVSGLTVAENRWPDEDEVYKRACHEWNKIEARLKQEVDQHITFSHGPVGIGFVADLHFGGKGVNYPQAFAEAAMVRDTPGLWLFCVGDVVDDFIIGNLIRERLNARLAIRDEWALVRKYLRVVGPKLVGACSGNHDEWVTALTGIDYFQQVLAQINPNCLYDKDDLRVELRVGLETWRIRVRHSWQGSSIYNSTHGIERGHKWDQDFHIGVAAHDHINGACRSFNAAGEQGMAVKAGTYKVDDSFARRKGFPKSGPSTIAVVVFDDDPRSITGFTSLEAACKYLDVLYDDELDHSD